MNWKSKIKLHCCPCVHQQQKQISLSTAVIMLAHEDWVHSCGSTITELLCVKIRLPNSSPTAVINLIQNDSLTCFRAAIDLWSPPPSSLTLLDSGVLLTVLPSITVHPCLFVEVFDTIRAVLSRSYNVVFRPFHFWCRLIWNACSYSFLALVMCFTAQ